VLIPRPLVLSQVSFSILFGPFGGALYPALLFDGLQFLFSLTKYTSRISFLDAAFNFPPFVPSFPNWLFFFVWIDRIDAC